MDTEVGLGACTQCDCDMYEEGENTNMCSYCAHAQTVHANLNGQFNREENFENVFYRIVKSFEFLSNSPQNFRLHYSDWKSHRLVTIKQFMIIADYLRKTKKNCNISKTVGSSVGLAGGILAGIATTAAIVGTGGVALIPMGIGGGAVALAGALTTEGTKVVEAAIFKKNIKEVQELWSEDNLECRILENYVVEAKKCKKDIEKIMDFEKFKDMMFLFNQEYQQGDDLNVIKQKFQNFKTFADPLLGCIAEFLNTIENFPNVENDFRKLVNTFEDPLNFIEKISKSALDEIQFEDFVNRLAVQATSIATRVAGVVANASVRTSIKALSNIALGIGVALDMLTLSTTFVDLAKGSPCEFAAILEICAEKIEQQVNNLEQVYQSFNFA